MIGTKRNPLRGKLGRTIRDQFMAGSIVLAPVAAVLLALSWLFTKIDGILRPAFKHYGLDFPGLGFVALILLVYLVGLIAHTGVRRMLDRGRNVIARIPFAGSVYGTVKDIASNTLGQRHPRFNRVVLLDSTDSGAKSLGFVTGEYKNAQGEPIVNVFVPGSPMPTSGSLYVCTGAQFTETNLTVEEAMKIITSAGMVTNQGLAR